MAFELKRKESVRKGLRRLGKRQAKTSLKALRDCENLEAVHEVRKGIKRLRALLRLGRAAVPGSDYRQCMGGLRDLAGQLAAARDACVKINTLKVLGTHVHGEKSPRLFRELEGILAADCRKEQTGLRGMERPKRSAVF
jgi:CHAD domain-containing protein